MQQIDGDSSIPAIIGTIILAILYGGMELIRYRLKARATEAPPPTSEAEWFVKELKDAYAELQDTHQATMTAFAKTQMDLQQTRETERAESREQIRKIKEEAKADMAEVAAYTRAVLQHYESGGRPPSPTAPSRVAHYLNP